MIKAAVQLTNHVRNPSFENGTSAPAFGSNWVTGSYALTYPNTGGMFGNSFSRATAGISNSVAAKGWYLNNQIAVVAGDKITTSYYVRPSVNIYAGLGLEQNNAAGNLGMLPSAGILCPANVWTRVSYTFTATGAATLVRPTFYMRSGTLAIGDYIDTDAYMVTTTDYVPDYRDATSAGWSWTGAANSSTSTGPYFLDKPAKVYTNLVNHVLRPNFTTPWAAFNQGTANAGTHTVAANEGDITVTALVGGNRRRGISNGTVGLTGTSTSSSGVLKANEWYLTMIAKVDTTGLAAGTRALMYADMRNGAGYGGGKQAQIDVGQTTVVHHSLVTVDFTGIDFFFWIYASPAADWTGTSTLKVKEAAVFVTRENITPTYFDGDSAGASWAGTPGFSKSAKPEWKDAIIKRWDGTSWITV